MAVAGELYNECPQKMSLQALSDEALVDLCLELQEWKRFIFSEVIDRYQDKLYRMARGMGLDPEDSRGITQAILFQTYLNLQGFKGESKFRTWLFSIGRNRCLNWIRRRSHASFTAIQDDLLPDSEQSAEERIIERESTDLVWKALDSLQEKYRQPLILLYFENKTYDQIALILDVPLRTVETRLYRARKQFKEVYSDLN